MLIRILLLIFLFVNINAYLNDEDVDQSLSKNQIFDIEPDLNFELQNFLVFKSEDRIFPKWYTIGIPSILPSSNKYQSKLFNFDSKSLFIYVQFLDNDTKVLIKDELNEKYIRRVKEDQIYNLIGDQLKCNLTYTHSNTFFKINGESMILNQFPLKIEFNLTNKHSEIKFLNDLKISCLIELQIQFESCCIASECFLVKVSKNNF